MGKNIWLYKATFLVLFLPIVFGGCRIPLEIFQQEQHVGGDSPESVVTMFFSEFNTAVNDPNITEQPTRLLWAGRLSSYFAPSERVKQQDVIALMLATFVHGRASIQEKQHLTVEIVYKEITLVNRTEQEAFLRIDGGQIRMRRLRKEPNGSETLLSEKLKPLSEVMGTYSDSFPVIEVNGRWFLTSSVQKPIEDSS